MLESSSGIGMCLVGCIKVWAVWAMLKPGSKAKGSACQYRCSVTGCHNSGQDFESSN